MKDSLALQKLIEMRNYSKKNHLDYLRLRMEYRLFNSVVAKYRKIHNPAFPNISLQPGIWRIEKLRDLLVINQDDKCDPWSLERSLTSSAKSCIAEQEITGYLQIAHIILGGKIIQSRHGHVLKKSSRMYVGRLRSIIYFIKCELKMIKKFGINHIWL